MSLARLLRPVLDALQPSAGLNARLLLVALPIALLWLAVWWAVR